MVRRGGNERNCHSAFISVIPAATVGKIAQANVRDDV
jgi:hypothetical protein